MIYLHSNTKVLKVSFFFQTKFYYITPCFLHSFLFISSGALQLTSAILTTLTSKYAVANSSHMGSSFLHWAEVGEQNLTNTISFSVSSSKLYLSKMTDFLGFAGGSSSSTNRHVHIHIHTYIITILTCRYMATISKNIFQKFVPFFKLKEEYQEQVLFHLNFPILKFLI